MPKKKAKPLWEDQSIEWFFASNSPTYPASAGSIPHDSRVDRGSDADEVRACFNAIHKAIETFDKSANQEFAKFAVTRDPAFFELHQRSFWPTRIGYKVSKPKFMSHFFGISVAPRRKETDEAFPGGMVASQEVRQIVEELQSGYAKFFPVQLAFKDQTVDGYSWIVQPIRIFSKDYEWDPGLDWVNGIEKPIVRMRRSKLTGIHWTQEENLKHIWSREAIRRFAPLILDRERSRITGLIPITVIED